MYNDPDDDGPDSLELLCSAAYTVACFAVAFAAIIYGLHTLGVF